MEKRTGRDLGAPRSDHAEELFVGDAVDGKAAAQFEGPYHARDPPVVRPDEGHGPAASGQELAQAEHRRSAVAEPEGGRMPHDGR